MGRERNGLLRIGLFIAMQSNAISLFEFLSLIKIAFIPHQAVQISVCLFMYEYTASRSVIPQMASCMVSVVFVDVYIHMQ